MTQSHPFSSDQYHIPWDLLTSDRVKADIDAALKTAEANLEAIRRQEDAAVSYESTFYALEVASLDLDRAWGRLNHLDSVCSNDEQRVALNAVLPEVSAFYAAIPLDAAIWRVLKMFSESSEASELDDIQKRYVEETCASFIKAGADLPDDKKSRVAEILARLSEVTQKFGENVLDSTNDWELIIEDKTRLAGLPKSALATASADAAAKGHEGKWRFTLQQPSMSPLMQFADDDALRKEVWAASGKVGYSVGYDNGPLIKEILKLRQEQAELLGFANFSDFILERRMAKSGSNALKFVEDMHAKVINRFQEESVGLKEWKAEQEQEEPSPLEPWQVAYWSEKRRKAEYDFDEEELRPYFPLHKVMDGMFGIVSKLYDLRIDEKATTTDGGEIQTWHSEVKFYDLFDNKSNELLGSFYADWHPRESKRGGAWMNSFETGMPSEGDNPREPHLGLMVGNMTKPIGDQPALMTHSEVETIFHEFGHLLHHLLGNVTVKSLSGTNVAWDFVELPSQIMENYCWSRESLDLFARHHETDEVIPETLFTKMTAAKNYMTASFYMRQLALSKLDMDLHIHAKKYADMDLDLADREILADYKPELATDSPSMARRFSHLFTSPVGYASAYYSYKWAEVLDADAFTRFQKEGILNPETGRSFREEILSKGNSAPAEELYRNFMGRDPDQTAFLERAGLA